MRIEDQEMSVQDHSAEIYSRVRYGVRDSQVYNEWRMQKLESLVDWSERASWTMLDNGCGIGRLSRWIKTRHERNVKVLGSDLSMEMLRFASESMDGFICQADSQILPFKDETFDVVFANSLLHHLPSPATGVEEIYRVLKPEGVLCLVDPNRALLPSFIRRLFQKKERFSDLHKEFNPSDLGRLLERRFYVESVERFGYLAYPLVGFPDVINFQSFLPFSLHLAEPLIALDNVLARVPLIRAQAFGFIMKARKKTFNG